MRWIPYPIAITFFRLDLDMASQENTMSGSPNVRRWSRNLSARRHRELERMNEMEKKRQLLEIRKQNDFFRQMSSAITGVDSATTTTITESTESTTIASNQLEPPKLSPDCIIGPPNGHANATANDRPAGRALAPGNNSPDVSPATCQSTHNSRNKNLLGQTAAGSQHANTTDTYQSQYKQIDLDLEQSSSGAELSKEQVDRCKDPANSTQQKLDVLTREQVNQFVSVAVPKNKRVLCLIVRDKLSRLHQAKSYFYPIYYLFIQAIVDVDDGQYNGGSYRYYPDYIASNNAAQGARGDQINGQCGSEPTAVDPPDTNSFSASSSISADMMFIGAAMNNQETIEANASNIKMSGTSYSDNELCDDNISGGEHTGGAGENSIPAHDGTVMLKNHIGLRSKASLDGVDGHNRFDESLVYPDNRQMASDKDDRRFSCSDAGAAAAAGQQSTNKAAGDRVQTRLKLASMMKSKFGLLDKSEKDKDEDDDFDEDDDEDDDNDSDGAIETSDQAHSSNNRGDSCRDNFHIDSAASKDFEKKLRFNEQQHGEGNNGNSDTTNKVSHPKAADIRASINVVAGLFENNRNPYIGTYGVLLSGKRRKKTKTYLIGLGEDGFMRKNSICKLKSNVLGTQFSATRSLSNPENNIIVDRCTIASINYETNVLGFKGPRKMRVLLTKDPMKPLKNLSEAYKIDPNCVAQLKNMIPSWNAESQSYVLNFHGRVTQASVKNFQLIESRDHLPTNMDHHLVAQPNVRQYPSPRDVTQEHRSGEHAGPSQPNGQIQLAADGSQASLERSSPEIGPEQEWVYAPNNNSNSNERFTSGDGRTISTSTSFGQSENNESVPMDRLSQSHKNLAYNSSIVMQFGRISNHEFTCDVMHPLSILQAFSIALSSFDSKLACE